MTERSAAGIFSFELPLVWSAKNRHCIIIAGFLAKTKAEAREEEDFTNIEEEEVAAGRNFVASDDNGEDAVGEIDWLLVRSGEQGT